MEKICQIICPWFIFLYQVQEDPKLVQHMLSFFPDQSSSHSGDDNPVFRHQQSTYGQKFPIGFPNQSLQFSQPSSVPGDAIAEGRLSACSMW